ncbi:hypothetical protein PL380_06575, partial [Bifidobacterium adolescentis]|uniref:hypothetical protein n=1 Tax=Bifidobacterium adolescentis TaxID=1680 RepID=UPI001E4BC7DB
YRTMTSGMKGGDIAALNAELRRLGYEEEALWASVPPEPSLKNKRAITKGRSQYGSALLHTLAHSRTPNI